MNIEVHREVSLGDYDTGGACCEVSATISVDPERPPSLQRRSIVHEVLEAYLPLTPHDKICDLEDSICEALEQWELMGQEGK